MSRAATQLRHNATQLHGFKTGKQGEPEDPRSCSRWPRSCGTSKLAALRWAGSQAAAALGHAAAWVQNWYICWTRESTQLRHLAMQLRGYPLAKIFSSSPLQACFYPFLPSSFPSKLHPSLFQALKLPENNTPHKIKRSFQRIIKILSKLI